MKRKTYESLNTADYPLRITEAPVNRSFFLEKKLHFYLTISVIATTLFSWFNLNSYLIILLVLCRLLDGNPFIALKTAFSNKYFLAYLSIFLLDLIGLFHTHQLFTGWKHMESKATLVAIPFILCSGPFTDKIGYQRLFSAYCLLLAVICCYCLSVAVVEYHWQNDPSVFFYHNLSSPISINAVFFSGYLILALLFLLFSPPVPQPAAIQTGASKPLTRLSRIVPRARLSRIVPRTWPNPALSRRLRTTLILFFTGMMVLLSSKLLLTVLVVIFFYYLAGRSRSRLTRIQFFGLGLLIVLGTGLLAFTDNPVSRRYKEVLPDNGEFGVQQGRPVHPAFNGVSLRLLMWNYAGEILYERKAWVFGVSAGDSQDLLDQKYLKAGMSQGYLGYNFHNEYIEVLVRSGIVGLCLMLLYTAMLFGLARSAATIEAAFTVAVLLLLSLTESSLEMQHSLFLSSFFPLLLMATGAPGVFSLPVIHRRGPSVPAPI